MDPNRSVADIQRDESAVRTESKTRYIRIAGDARDNFLARQLPHGQSRCSFVFKGHRQESSVRTETQPIGASRDRQSGDLLIISNMPDADVALTIGSGVGPQIRREINSTMTRCQRAIPRLFENSQVGQCHTGDGIIPDLQNFFVAQSEPRYQCGGFCQGVKAIQTLARTTAPSAGASLRTIGLPQVTQRLFLGSRKHRHELHPLPSSSHRVHRPACGNGRPSRSRQSLPPAGA